ncbi:MAG TPA: hypothetical protein VJC03_00560, partial [bacterium]|nr:hypothetical protein [bacterium]
METEEGPVETMLNNSRSSSYMMKMDYLLGLSDEPEFLVLVDGDQAPCYIADDHSTGKKIFRAEDTDGNEIEIGYKVRVVGKGWIELHKEESEFLTEFLIGGLFIQGKNYNAEEAIDALPAKNRWLFAEKMRDRAAAFRTSNTPEDISRAELLEKMALQIFNRLARKDAADVRHFMNPDIAVEDLSRQALATPEEIKAYSELAREELMVKEAEAALSYTTDRKIVESGEEMGGILSGMESVSEKAGLGRKYSRAEFINILRDRARTAELSGIESDDFVHILNLAVDYLKDRIYGTAGVKIEGIGTDTRVSGWELPVGRPAAVWYERDGQKRKYNVTMRVVREDFTDGFFIQNEDAYMLGTVVRAGPEDFEIIVPSVRFKPGTMSHILSDL